MTNLVDTAIGKSFAVSSQTLNRHLRSRRSRDTSVKRTFDHCIMFHPRCCLAHYSPTCWCRFLWWRQARVAHCNISNGNCLPFLWRNDNNLIQLVSHGFVHTVSPIWFYIDITSDTVSGSKFRHCLLENKELLDSLCIWSAMLISRAQFRVDNL